MTSAMNQDLDTVRSTALLCGDRNCTDTTDNILISIEDLGVRYKFVIPRLMAITTAWVRSLTPSLLKILLI
jgi:hypothetical protein